MKTVCPLSNHHNGFMTFHILYDHFAFVSRSYCD